MGAKSRTKGKRGELESAAIAREEGFATARRSAPMQAGHAGAYEDLAEVGRLAIENKRYKRTPVNRFARVHLAREIPGFVPVLAYRDDHQPEPFAVIRLRDLLRLERQALGKAPASPATGCREGCRCAGVGTAPVNGWDAAEAAERAERERFTGGKDPEQPA